MLLFLCQLFFKSLSSIFAWKNPLNRGAWRVLVHGVATSWTWLSMLACMPNKDLNRVAGPVHRSSLYLWGLHRYCLDLGKRHCRCLFLASDPLFPALSRVLSNSREWEKEYSLSDMDFSEKPFPKALERQSTFPQLIFSWLTRLFEMWNISLASKLQTFNSIYHAMHLCRGLGRNYRGQEPPVLKK